MAYTGRCACGAVTATIAAEAPIAVRQCWCRQCQQVAAGAHTTNAMFLTADVTITGTLGTHAYTAASGNTLPVIVMTGHGDVPIAVAAMKAGAADFLEKPFDDERLLRSVQAALAASVQQSTSPEVTGMLERLTSLTPREREVFNRLVAGQPNKTIAYDLGSSPRTVEVQRARVMEKMEARSLAELVRMAVALERGGFITSSY